MSYVPTGFPLGRPRKDEIRPDTQKSIAAKKYREENADWLPAYNTERSQAWRANHPERATMHDRNAYARKKAYASWTKKHVLITVTTTFEME